MARPFFSLLCSVILLAGVSACGSSRPRAPRVNPTYIEVAPEEFLGELSCVAGSGGVQRYVATLIDVTDRPTGEVVGPFRLVSSPPTPCTTSVFFSNVVAPGSVLDVFQEGRQYVAELHAYDTLELQAKHPGSPVMLQGERTLPPRWIGACGLGRLPEDGDPTMDAGFIDAGLKDAGSEDPGVVDERSPIERALAFRAPADAGALSHFGGPVTPVAGRTVRLRGCHLEEVVPGLGTTRVVLDVQRAFTEQSCGNGPGQVSHFEVTLGDRTESAHCGEFVVFEDLEPERFARFELIAYEAVPTPAADGGVLDSGVLDGSAARSGTLAEREPKAHARWATWCYQEPLAGIELVARCDPLRPIE